VVAGRVETWIVKLHTIEASVLIGEEALATGQKLAAYYEATPTML
jgi:hypothetical protein